MRTHPLLIVILAGLSACAEPWEETSACMAVADNATCPAPDDVEPDDLTVYGWCDEKIKSIDGEGEASTIDPEFGGDPDGGTPACCYPVTARNTEPNCVVGRPFVDGGQALCAPMVDGRGWSVAPGAPDPERARLWMRMAQGEHASIASFARLSLQLLALGAPADLVADVQQAGLDEVHHARLACGLASRYAGRAVQPGPLPLPQHLDLRPDPAQLAYAAVREGCLGETVGAWLAHRAVTHTTDADERAVVERIVADESRHAALSWRLVVWLMEVGGQAVRDQVEQAFAEPFAVSDPWGRASVEDCEQAREQVVVPAYRVLMG